ncbi:hypothetical protein K2173_010465 [Erythroxylum novogranatense]|uniref:Cellulose synthase-like protein E1 n=1 Tax=Erythroxylum novogranatense TaxID=1862640 RepID=A0AAV8TDX7_9ROSI|nr:hypothetical protein K2173_010465 [Erythroxylum novogranatense]
MLMVAFVTGTCEKEMGSDMYTPLFETRRAKGRVLYRLFAVTVFTGICLIWAYRLSHIPRTGEAGRWVWIGAFGADLWFGLYWILTQASRWNVVYRFTFKDRLSNRHDKELPGVDIFVCTADPAIEPPLMVMNTILSVVAYDYPPEKLSVYLSDDAGSDLTFYALLEASNFAKHWIPYCKKFKVEPRSPAAYFSSICANHDETGQDKQLLAIKKLYKEMEERLENVVKLNRVPDDAKLKHKGFSEWESYSSRRDHGAILQIVTDGKDPRAVDVDGCALPTLVYLAREKRPEHHHNFKAGALNALLRVSVNISNGAIILTLDCDMYSNDSLSIRDALCFFMDEEKSHDIAFVQFSMKYNNITKNDIYGGLLRASKNVEFHGADGYGGPLYVGSCCFHRRDALCGRKYTKDCKLEYKSVTSPQRQESTEELEERIKYLATCTYEQNTQWGGEMGLKYGCPVEDVITGLSIKCRGWRSVYFNPKREGFCGVSPTSLTQTLVQHKRWSEGDFQILFSKYSPAWYAYGRISIGLQMVYSCYCLWALNCLATLYYAIIPSLCLLKGVPLFPQASSPWFLPFVYVISAKYIYSLAEFLFAGGTVQGWWNEQRIWLYKRTSSYLLGFIDSILKLLGFAESGFVITSKIADDDVLDRHEKEIMEFGDSSSMLTILATIAMLNLYCFVGVVKNVIMDAGAAADSLYNTMPLQILLCAVLVLINFPLYRGLFFRRDKGRLPSSAGLRAFVLAFLACSCFNFLH